MKLLMCVYLGCKFEVSSIIPMSFRQGWVGTFTPFLTSKQNPKKSAQIRVIRCTKKHISKFLEYHELLKNAP